jgi:hypothetical protein
MRRVMKRTIPLLAVTAGIVGATLTGVAPASAAVPASATNAVDCSSPEYTYRVHSYVPTNIQRPAVDGRSYNISGPQAYTTEVCLDIPDSSTFTIEVRILASDGSTRTLFVDDRPGDKVFRFSTGAYAFWQVYGTLTGPPSTYLYYDWAEKHIPA